jgi:hypothetical protein
MRLLISGGHAVALDYSKFFFRGPFTPAGVHHQVLDMCDDPHKVGHALEQEEEEVPNALSRPLEGLEITPSFQFRKKTGTRKGKGSFDHMSK